MQPQYSQGTAPSHHPPPYAPPEVSQANGGSITSSLRQWRKKDYVEKQQPTDQPQTSVAESSSHVARVAPHTYYPRLTDDVCHYQHQYAEYGVPYKPPVPAPVKYSEIVDNTQTQTIEHITPVIPKLKDKDFGDICGVPPQPHLKQYQDQMSLKQPYPDGTKQTYSDPAVHHQYISKDSQIHPFLQKQSQMDQYIQKEPYQQFLPKYGMQSQYPQYPSEPNNFLAHLNKINPRMAQSIINDTHLRDPQIPVYHTLDQNRSYQQPQRMYHTPPIHSSPTHAHRNIPQPYNYTQPYNYNVKSNMQPNDPYNRVHQYQHNVPKYLPDYKMNAPLEQPIPNISPQRMYNENVHMNYAPMSPKMSPNYPHCGQLEYAQHYQHRRAQLAQAYYPHSAYKSAYVQNPQVSPESGGSESRTRKSSLKQYLETWVEEDISGNLPDIVVSNNLSDVENMENLKGTLCVKASGTQEQPLYVLDTTEIPNETLPHFLHLQQFEKLPDNIRGYYHSTNAVPPGSRRIIIESNSSEDSPENSQVVRGNSTPIVPKLPEVFTENSSAIAIENQNIVNQKAVENRKKIITTAGTSANIGKGLENQLQNLENKVVQIHILEDSEAATDSSHLSNDITAALDNHHRNSSDAADTVIIQSDVYHQHNSLQPRYFTKLVADDENCVIKESVSQGERVNQQSMQSETKLQANVNQDDVKNMPFIDESIGGAHENKITKQFVILPLETASNHNSVEEKHAEEKHLENMQAVEENLSSRRSSICSIYKEMEHIHGENSGTTATNNLEPSSTKKSEDFSVNSENSEDVPYNLDPTQTIYEPNVHSNSKTLNESINSDKINIEQLHSCVQNTEQRNTEQVIAKDNHSKPEMLHTVTSDVKEELTSNTVTFNSNISEGCDGSSISSGNCSTDLTYFTNTEIPFSLSKDRSGSLKTENIKTIKECIASEVKETMLENENHRHVNKKLRTAKLSTTNITEEDLFDTRSTAVEKSDQVETNPKASCTVELHQRNANSHEVLEGKNKTIAVAVKADEVIPQSKEYLLHNTKEKNYKENESTDNSVRTILQIPNTKGKISRSCSQSSIENLIPVKDNFVDEIQIENELSSNTEFSNEACKNDEMDRFKNLANLLIEDDRIIDDNNEDASQSVTSNTCPEISFSYVENVINLEKNEETTHVPDHKSIIKDRSDSKLVNESPSQVIESGETENAKKLNSTESDRKLTNIVTGVTKIGTVDVNIANVHSSVEPISDVEFCKNLKENVIFVAESDRESFIDEVSAENYMQTVTPLNLSMDKKCLHKESKTKNSKLHENRIETSTVSNKEMENTCISDEFDDPLSTKCVSAGDEISKPAHIRSLIQNAKKQVGALKITTVSNTKYIKHRRKKQSSKTTNSTLLAKTAIKHIPSRKEEMSESKNFSILVENTEKKVDNSEIAGAVSAKLTIEVEKKSTTKEERITKSESLSLVVENAESILDLPHASGAEFEIEFETTKSVTRDDPISKSAIFNLFEENVNASKMNASDIEEISEAVNNSFSEESANIQMNVLETIDVSNTRSNTESTEMSEATMPTLECMINYDEELESFSTSLSSNTTNLENAAKSTDVNCDLDHQNSSSKTENVYNLPEVIIPQMKSFKTSNRRRHKEKNYHRESTCIANERRKSRRLNKSPLTINQENHEEERHTSKLPFIEENNVQQITEAHHSDPQSISSVMENFKETASCSDNTKNFCTNEERTCVRSVNLEQKFVSFSKGANRGIETIACTKLEEDTESTSINNFKQEHTSNDGQNTTDDGIKCDASSFCTQESSAVLENVHVSEVEINFSLQESEAGKDSLGKSETTAVESIHVTGNQEEGFENNDTGIVYQINDTSVVLQIADELLEINVTAQNGRKVILVKTLSDAIIMNNSEENDCQSLEDTCAIQYEDSNSNIEVQNQKLSENEKVLNNNYIDCCNTFDLKTANTDINDEQNLCLKEMCTGTDITTVGDDVCIYNEEVVSSSTEIETVPITGEKEEKTVTAVDDQNSQRKYTRKSSGKDKKVSWEDEKHSLNKTECLTADSLQKDNILKPKVGFTVSESTSSKKLTNVKDSVTKGPKTKAALKFVETTTVSKPKAKEPKVPFKITNNLKINQKEETDDLPDKSFAKLVKKQQSSLQQNSVKEESIYDCDTKNVLKQKQQYQGSANKNENHTNSNKTKTDDFQPKPEKKEKLDGIHKTKEKAHTKNSEKMKEINVSITNKRCSSSKEEKTNKLPKLSLVSKKKPNIDDVNEKLQKATTPKIPSDNTKNQKRKITSEETASQDTKNNVKRDSKNMIHSEIGKNFKTPKKVENKKTRSKSLQEHSKTRTKQKTEDKVKFIEKEGTTALEKHSSVQENSITSSTSQENEALVKERSSKLIQHITDDWDDDHDEVKTRENSCRRRLSLQEYNNRKRTNSVGEQETIQSCDLIKPYLTDNLFNNGNIVIGNKNKRTESPESPILSVKFNNKTYSRNSSIYPVKTGTIPNVSGYEQDVGAKTKSTVPHYIKEEPLSSAIELHLPKINRSPRPVYNQEYLKNALVNDLQAVNAYTTTLIKENQQLMQRFLEQKRLTADELKKVKLIIRYKRLVQHLSSIRINDMQATAVRENHVIKQDTDSILCSSTNTSLNPAAHLKLTPNLSVDFCDGSKKQLNSNQIVNTLEKSSKMNQFHLEENVKVNVEKRKKKRFRFLYSDEESESHGSSAFSSTALTSSESNNLKRPRLDNPVPALENKVMDYSVHQSNSQGQLTLVFKRSFKSDPKMQPFVRLERLPSIDLLARNRFN